MQLLKPTEISKILTDPLFLISQLVKDILGISVALKSPRGVLQ